MRPPLLPPSRCGRPPRLTRPLTGPCSYDKKIMVWSFKNGALLRTLESSHTSHVFDLALDSSKIVSAGHDKRAFVYDFGDPETGRLFA